MYIVNKKYDQAYEFASKYLPHNEINSLYCKNAQKFEFSGRYKEAETLYIRVNDIESVINMYKKAKK